jgi:hypothetical protein
MKLVDIMLWTAICISHLLARFYDIGDPALMSGVAGRARRSCYARPAKKPTNETPLDERWYTPLSSVQCLYVVELKLSLRTQDACTIHREVYY